MITQIKTIEGASDWSRRYQSALRRYLQMETKTSLRSALRLGRQAVTLGMETLDVARIHVQALTALASTGGTSWIGIEPIECANAFFAEVIVPIEQTHCSALKADAQVNQLTQSLRQRTREAEASSLHLKRGVVRRQAAEKALDKSVQNRDGLIAEAERLQLHLHNLTHEILAAQESGRQANSSKLRDEISQILLAIHVRLLALNNAVVTDADSLKSELAKTQRVVKHCASIVNRRSNAFEGNYEA